MGEEVMAYFSNGSEGEVLDEMCGKCAHYWACPVYHLQASWNYEQFGEDAVSKAKKYALELMVPQKDGKTTCTMFTPKTWLNETGLAEAERIDREQKDAEKLAEHERIYGKSGVLAAGERRA